VKHDLYLLALFVGMGLMTLLTRTFFFLSERDLVLPDWARRGLRYAPLAALAAVVAPEVFSAGEHLAFSWHDARLYSVAAATVWYLWRGGLLGTIVAGMAVLVPLKVLLGW
jgi:branched-subunit amino acid transport protein